MLKIKSYIVAAILSCRNWINRLRLTNKSPMIIANNCLGGFIYHWLGCEFRTPFINCRMYADDFIVALENFQDFMNFDIIEDIEQSVHEGFPVGIGFAGVRVYFSHYSSFDEAMKKWNKRKSRMDRQEIGGGKFYYKPEHMVIFLSLPDADAIKVERFDRLPFKYKQAFIIDRKFCGSKNCFFMKNYDFSRGLWVKEPGLRMRRYIDRFDYVKLINAASSYSGK